MDDCPSCRGTVTPFSGAAHGRRYTLDPKLHPRYAGPSTGLLRPCGFHPLLFGEIGIRHCRISCSPALSLAQSTADQGILGKPGKMMMLDEGLVCIDWGRRKGEGKQGDDDRRTLVRVPYPALRADAVKTFAALPGSADPFVGPPPIYVCTWAWLTTSVSSCAMLCALAMG
jgi:hypothetical protein